MKPETVYIVCTIALAAMISALAFGLAETEDKVDRILRQLDGWQPVMEHQRAETQEILNQNPNPKGKTDAKRK